MEQSEAAKFLRYEPDTGHMFWVVSAGTVKAGARAGYITNTGYLGVGLCGKKYLVHRLAWLLHFGKWPDGELDHINGSTTDNRMENLRLANRSQQMGNRRGFSRLGLPKGVAKSGPGTFQAQMCIAGKQTYLGNFPTAELAHAAYCKTAKEVHGQFFSNGRK